MAPRPFDCLSLCSGYGGLDLAARLVFPAARSVVHVEGEAWAVACLVEKMRGSLLADAPVWSDARTFDGRPWRGVVDCVLAGIPCQGNSLAGKRLLEDDPRDLWPDCRRVLREVGCEYLLLENVAGFLVPGRKLKLTAPAARVLGELAEDGFDAEWLTLAASDVGATHQRKRFWLLAKRRELDHAAGQPGGVEPGEQQGQRPEVPRRTGEPLAHDDAERPEPARHGPGEAGAKAKRRRVATCGPGDGLGETVVHPDRRGVRRRRKPGDMAGAGRGVEAQEGERQRGGRAAARTGCSVADADGRGRDRPTVPAGRRQEGQGAADAGGSVATLGHADCDGLEGINVPRPPPGDVGGAVRAVDALPLFPPGPLDADGWRSVLGVAPWLAPAIRPSEAESVIRLLADGAAADLVRSREHRLRLGGNGVVPLQGGVALAVLWKRLNGAWPWEEETS